MNVILAIVMSLDGKSTRGDLPPSGWASNADQKYFSGLLKENNLLIFGKNTYFSIKGKVELSPKRLRVVMTKDAKKYKNEEVSGQLEFSDESPKKLLMRLQKKGFEKALLLSGEKLNTSFFKDGLIDELWITLEPRIFGAGKEIVMEESLDVRLRLQEYKKISDEGTILLKYKVLKSRD